MEHTMDSYKEQLFTSESVSEGHPDKLCDRISDAILDAHMKMNPYARVAAETLTTRHQLVISGEVNLNDPNLPALDIEQIAREAIRDVGYTDEAIGFDDKCNIFNCLHQQSTELNTNEGAGDQGLMFGYACDHTSQYMPLPIEMAHRLVQKLAEVRKANIITEIYPDAKSQVTFEIHDRIPTALKTVVISTHHRQLDKAGFQAMQDKIKQLVIQPVLAEVLADCRTPFSSDDVDIMVNPLGMWETGGPLADTGLTGRKIIVDTYGGWARHGGGAFSGKDATKVDRSAAYMARHIAKSVVASGLAKECEIQFSFVIGEKYPVSLMVDTFGSGIVPEKEIEAIIAKNFDLSVKGIIDYLNLRQPIYQGTASYGHFGRKDISLPWEEIKILK